MERQPILIPRLKECPFENPYGYIYIFTNKINGHKYIGKHKFNQPYIDETYHGSGGRHWQYALQYYGWDGVSPETVMGEKNPMYGDHRFTGKIITFMENIFVESLTQIGVGKL